MEVEFKRRLLYQRIIPFLMGTLHSVNLVHQQSYPQNPSDNSRFQSNLSYDNSRGRRKNNNGKQRNLKNKIQCQICHKFDHLADKCFFRVPGLYNTKLIGSSTQPQTPVSAMLVTPDLNRDTNWYPD